MKKPAVGPLSFLHMNLAEILEAGIFNSDILHGTIVSLALTQGAIRHLMCRRMKIITASTEQPEIFLTC